MEVRARKVVRVDGKDGFKLVVEGGEGSYGS